MGLKPISSRMKVSIVVPAFNEERCISSCLEAIDAALKANAAQSFGVEVIVVDNNSTDRTAELAREAGARVCFEPVNRIGRARNAGAGQARGEWLIFVDADSWLNPALVADVFGLIGAGAVVGCGSKMHMDDLPWWGRFLMATWTAISVLCRWASGALFVCRADAFHDVGGFSEDLYVTEEIDLSRRLKKWGRKRGLKFVILRAHPLHTSSRKLQLYSGAEIARQFFWLCVRPGRSLKDRKYLSMWYDGRR
jgi:glycosyltransferase involved in cell wall biosynthesis